MKKFLSALTAFCMCASMTAASLPASALTMSDSSAINSLAGELTWSMNDTIFTPGVDEYVVVEVMVEGDTGTFGYDFTPLADGSDFVSAGFEIMDVEQVTADEGGYGFTTFQANMENGHIGSAKDTDGDATVADGTSIIKIYVAPPADAQPGHKYELTFKGLSVGNFASEKKTPATKNGSITIAGGDSDTNVTTETQDTTAPVTDATETQPGADTPSMDDKKNASEWTWYFDDNTYNPKTKVDGKGNEGYAEVAVYVTKDPGTYGYDFTPLIDGKTFAEMGFELLDVSQADTGYGFSTFQVNNENGHIGSAKDTEGNATVADGSCIITLALGVPDSVVPGTTYSLTFKDLSVGDEAEVKHTPATIAGTLKIVDEEETTTEPQTDPPEATTAPTTAAPTTEATEATTPMPTTQPATTAAPTTAPYVEQTSEVADFIWDIGEVECEAGATVQVPVTIEGNPGFNSYILGVKADAGVTAGNPENGAVEGLSNVQFNLTNNTYGDTYTAGNAVVGGNGTVFYLTYTVPADAVGGTVYNLSIDKLDVFNSDMVKLIPTTNTGYIKVKETPTEATTEPFVDESKNVDAQWIIGTTEVDAGATVSLPISVVGDKDGLNSYIAKITADEGAVASKAEAGDAYAALNFESNIAALTFGGTNTAAKNADAAADNATVFAVTFTVPEDAAPGTIYNVKWADLEIRDGDYIRLVPAKVDGWIKIKDEVPTETTTTEAPTTTTEEVTTTTEAPTTTTEEATTTTDAPATDAPATEPPALESQAIDAEWIIATTEVEAGATVALPITVKGDTLGLNSYIAKVKADAALTANGAEAGNAYGALDFVPNVAALTFGGTYYEDKGTGNGSVPAAADGSTVFSINFQVPDASAINFSETDEKGAYALFPVTWDSLNIVDGSMTTLIPSKVDGWIKVYKPEEPATDEPEDVTMYKYRYSLNGQDKFYFSHDSRPFDQIYADATLERCGVKSDGTTTEWKTISVGQLSGFVVATIDGGYLNPQAYFNAKNPDWATGTIVEAYNKVPLQVTITDKLPDGTEVTAVLKPDAEDADEVFNANAIIGVKGDTDLNGLCNASDAAEVLLYAAAIGAGETAAICKVDAAATLLGAEVAENFVFFLSDVDGESENHGAGADSNPLNASDAALQLIYAAAVGAKGADASWFEDALGTDTAAMPAYSAALYTWLQKA